MHTDVKALLQAVQDGAVSVDDALLQLKQLLVQTLKLVLKTFTLNHQVHIQVKFLLKCLRKQELNTL